MTQNVQVEQPASLSFGSQSRSFNSLVVQFAIYIILVVLVVISAVVSPVFLSVRNVSNLLKQAASLGVAAVGQTFVILTGGIDLSVAAVVALMSVLAANLMAGEDRLVLPVVLFCLLVATLIGFVNGLLVTKLKIPAFIATLGMILLVQGVRFLYTGGAPKGSIPEALRFWGRGSVGPIPTALILWIVIALCGAAILHYTTFGRQLYAVGGNRNAANLSGISVDGITIAAYTICSFLAGVAGLMLTGYIGLADNWLGRGYELDSIAAVVVGGTILEGGKGSMLSSIAGVLIIVVLYNLVLLLGLDEETQRIVKGVAVLIAVALYMRLRASK